MAEGQWEYKIVEGAQDSAERQLNEAAAEGWEAFLMSAAPGVPVASIVTVLILLRRPKPSS
ncbi:MAG: hypothetical protein ACE5R4_09420 [Armatimonadota bacterium]